MNIVLGNIYGLDIYCNTKTLSDVKLVKVFRKLENGDELYEEVFIPKDDMEKYLVIDIETGQQLICMKQLLSDSKECLLFSSKNNNIKTEELKNFFSEEKETVMLNSYFKDEDVEVLDEVVDELLDTKKFSKISKLTKLQKRLTYYLSEVKQ